MIHKEDKTQEQSLNFVEEWNSWSQSLRGWISEHFGFAETQPLKEAALDALNFIEEFVNPNFLLSAIHQSNGLINFVDFLVHFGLSSGEEQEEVLTSGHDFYHFMVEESCWADSNLEVADLVKILTSSKEEVINDFVIPFYKIPKSNSLDLSWVFGDAFAKGINRLTFGEISWTHWVFDPIRESFSTSDYVGVFEYFLEGQDLQELESSTLSRREEWTKAILLEEETFEDY